MDKQTFYAQARRDLRGPLAGIRVVEATTTWAGPMAGCMLADLGATVIKVEHPGGEVSRLVAPRLPDSTLTVVHETVNRNKQNVSLDLHQAQGRAIFLELCASADIVVENFKPGTMAGWGVGYADVAAVKPDIIYVSISGFGQFGPYSDRPGYDPIAQNFSGWSSLNGAPGGSATKAPTFLGDDLSGLHGALSALAALQHRHRTGEGQHIDVALVDVLMFQSNGKLTEGALDLPLGRWGNQFGGLAPSNVYACADGEVYAGVLLDSHWRAFCALAGREDLATMNNAERVARREEVDGLMAGWCRTRGTAEVVAQFTTIGLTATRVNSYAESARDAHVAERDVLQTVTLSDGHAVPLTAPPAKFSRTPTAIHNPAPGIGQDTDAVLEGLGYDAEARARLRAERVI